MEPARSLQKEWWLRALAVFQSPRGTFAALRDDSAEAAEARQEPIMAIVILAGIAGILTTSLSGRLLDDPNFDGLNVAVWAFLGGAFYGLLVFWLGGLLVYAIASRCACARLVPAGAARRRARHGARRALGADGVAGAPRDLRRGRLPQGGSDAGAGDKLFERSSSAPSPGRSPSCALGLIELRKSSSSSSAIA